MILDAREAPLSPKVVSRETRSRGSMPFDIAIAHGRPAGVPSVRSRRAVSIWLFTICAMLLGMIALGGATRLTGSGLSIMEWQPISGIIPPLSHGDWERLFAIYKTIPQYKLQHEGFGLTGFQQIFWLEWIHRFWGRLTGLAFLLPFLYFAVTGQIRRKLLPGLVVIFALGVLQGFVGWFMVSSGFFPNTDHVATVRLVAHLTMALVLYGAILWVAMTEWVPFPTPVPGALGLRRLIWGVLALTALTILAGGFTAGSRAGYLFNTFPLMDGHLVPTGYAMLHPVWLNWFQNPAAIQFDHRLLATATALAALAAALWGTSPRLMLPQGPRDAMLALGATVVVQYALGVATLLLVVPVDLATLHQVVAVLLLSAALIALHSLRGARPHTF
jgi:cytochrome c oxidase assembly protein subunit 15